ncbi:MAG TPA: right-handed parallel beta-helix repeat-containing protein [Planctomycetaceae bacterium]|nr:right-handed parallel beta-helix repeat-containing protein [Planctomycetaceae bacterium]
MTNVREYGAAGDGVTDDTMAIQHALHDGPADVTFPPGDYKISRTLLVDLTRGRQSIQGSGGVARLVMHGAGPAISLLGSHAGSADPTEFRAEEWQHERMPTVSGIEIIGQNPAADGIAIEGVMQATLTGVLIRQVRTAVRATKRARNILIDGCHFYHCTGIGVHLDRVNLHQTIIGDSHISYCRLGGIRIEGSEIRNLQITGCDIEYNNNRRHGVEGADEEPTAEIYIDAREGSVREGTIASCTIQATASKNGSNIRFIGHGNGTNHKAGMWAISGNLIGSQETNIHLTSARGVVISGNYIYSGHHRNLLVEECRDIVLTGNCFGHNPDYEPKELCTGVRFVDSTNCNLSGVLIQDCATGKHTVADALNTDRKALLELVRCQGFNMTGLQVLDGAPYGIWLEKCSEMLMTGCTVLENREEKLMKAAIRWNGEGRNNMIATSRLGKGTDATVAADGQVKLVDNVEG